MDLSHYHPPSSMTEEPVKLDIRKKLDQYAEIINYLSCVKNAIIDVFGSESERADKYLDGAEDLQKKTCPYTIFEQWAWYGNESFEKMPSDFYSHSIRPQLPYLDDMDNMAKLARCAAEQHGGFLVGQAPMLKIKLRSEILEEDVAERGMRSWPY